MIRIGLVFFTMMVVLLVSCKKDGTSYFAPKIQCIVGEVRIISEKGKNMRTAVSGDILGTGDIVSAGKASVAEILIGSRGIVRVFENTELKISTLMADTATSSAISMSKGRVYVIFSKLKKNSYYQVITPTLVASIRGTSFRVSAQEKKVRLDVLNGNVVVNPVIDGTIRNVVEKLVEKNQSVIIDEKLARAAFERKKSIDVVQLKPEEIIAIKEEATSIKPKVIEKLDIEARKEINREISDMKDDAAKARKKKKKSKSKRELTPEERARLEEAKKMAEQLNKSM